MNTSARLIGHFSLGRVCDQKIYFQVYDQDTGDSMSRSIWNSYKSEAAHEKQLLHC